jgi:hypothetical protein
MDRTGQELATDARKRTIENHRHTKLAAGNHAVPAAPRPGFLHGGLIMSGNIATGPNGKHTLFTRLPDPRPCWPSGKLTPGAHLLNLR